MEKEDILTKINVIRRNLAWAEQSIEQNWNNSSKMNTTEKSRATKKVMTLSKDSAELHRLTN